METSFQFNKTVFIYINWRGAKTVKPLFDGDYEYTSSLCAMYQCTQVIPSSDLGLTDLNDVECTLRQMCCVKLCLVFFWRLINIIRVDGSPLRILHVIVSDQIKHNLQ